MPDKQIYDWAGLAGKVRSARAKGTRRVAVVAGTAALTAAAVAGITVTAQPTGAATVHTATVRTVAPATCRPRTDFRESRTNSGSGSWPGHFCGTGYRHPWHHGQVWEHFQKVWDATRPYHRVWFHENGQSWCIWGPSHRVVPHAFKVPGNILITSNTAPCPH